MAVDIQKLAKEEQRRRLRRSALNQLAQFNASVVDNTLGLLDLGAQGVAGLSNMITGRNDSPVMLSQKAKSALNVESDPTSVGYVAGAITPAMATGVGSMIKQGVLSGRNVLGGSLAELAGYFGGEAGAQIGGQYGGTAGEITGGLLGGVVSPRVDMSSGNVTAMPQRDTSLDMSQGARMQRAADQGYVGGIYHGSTHDISEFDLDPMNPESHFGKGVYTTTSPEDASLNYAGEGPDLSNRIQQRAEQLESAEDLPPNEAMQRARQELKGSNEGVVYPLMGRTTNPFDISSEGDTFLEYRQRELDPEDYLDEADGDMDLAIELAQDDSYNFEPEGELVDFLDALQRNPSLSAEDFATLQQNILEEAYDGGISASRLDEIFRGSDIYPEDEMGNLVGNDVFRQAIKDTGYDTIIHDANIFRGMEATDGAQHRIFLNPNQLRSPNADFDPAKMDSSNLLSSVPTSSLRDIA